MTPEALRKTAVLISSLDTQAADALLEQMGPAVADRVRAAVMDLPEISEDEQQRVIAEFMGRKPRATPPRPTQPDEEVELELSAAAEETVAALPPAAPAPVRTGKPFAFLAEVDAATIARIVQKEAPQIAAVVLAHLDAKQAADVLKHLPATLSGDILFRIANLDDMSDDVLADLEQQMQTIVSPHLRTQAERAKGVARLDAILQALPTESRGSFAAAVAHRDERLAHDWLKPSPPPVPAERTPPPAVGANKPAAADSIAFEELAALDDAAWGRVLNSAEPETVLLAFAGAEPKLIDRLVRGLPRREADVWRKQFAHPGPVRLRDIDAAQEQLAEIAVDLAEQGLIRFPRRRGFAAVA